MDTKPLAGRWWFRVIGLLLLAGLGLTLVLSLFFSKRQQRAQPLLIGPELKAVSSSPPAEGQTCVNCHAAEVDDWRQSQHANANRLFDPNVDLPAFRPNRVFAANGLQTILRADKETATIAVT